VQASSSLGISAVQLSSILAGQLSYHCATVKGVCMGRGLLANQLSYIEMYPKIRWLRSLILQREYP